MKQIAVVTARLQTFRRFVEEEATEEKEQYVWVGSADSARGKRVDSYIELYDAVDIRRLGDVRRILDDSIEWTKRKAQ